MVLSRKDRKAVKNKLIAVQGNVLHTLSQASQAVWGDYCFDKENIIKCFTAWINLKEEPNILNCLNQLPLFTNIIQLLQDNRYCHAASTCLVDIMENL